MHVFSFNVANVSYGGPPEIYSNLRSIDLNAEVIPSNILHIA
jgi:hypothetical protein